MKSLTSGLGVNFCVMFLILVGAVSEAQGKFELIKQWNQSDGQDSYGNPSRRFADGSRYINDRSPGTEYPLWRLVGDQLTPVTGLTRDESPAGSYSFYPVEDWTTMWVWQNNVFTSVWRINGDEVIPVPESWGTFPLTDAVPLVVFAHGVLISGVHPDYGRELWLLDKEGYHLLKDVNSGPADSHTKPTGSSLSIYLGGNGTQSLFRLDDGENGEEPWVHTAESMTLTFLADIAPGPGTVYPRRLVQRGSDVYFGVASNNVYKFDGTNLELIPKVNSTYSTAPQPTARFTVGDVAYAWWDDYYYYPGLVVRVTADDQIKSFRPAWGPNGELAIRSVAYWDNVLQVLGQGTHFSTSDIEITVDDEGTDLSYVFSGMRRPTVRRFTDTELLFSDEYPTLNKTTVVNCIAGDATRMMWKEDPQTLESETRFWDSEDWIYLTLPSFANYEGVTQLWGMKWPEGCYEDWRPELVHESSFE